MQRPLEHMKKEPLHKLPEKSKTWVWRQSALQFLREGEEWLEPGILED